MLGFGIAVVSKGRVVGVFADMDTTEGFIAANSSREYVLAVRPLNRVIYRQTIPAHLPNMVAVHLVR